MTIRTVSIVLVLALVGCGCRSPLRKAEDDFAERASAMGWYGPTMTSLYEAVAEYHRVKGKPVPNAAELAKFIGKPLQFTVGPTGEEKTFTVSWTEIEISPNGWDSRDPECYSYKTNVYGVLSTMGVEGLTAPKAKSRAPLPRL